MQSRPPSHPMPATTSLAGLHTINPNAVCSNGCPGIQSADFSGWDGGTAAPVFRQLVSAIRQKLGPAPAVEAVSAKPEEVEGMTVTNWIPVEPLHVVSPSELARPEPGTVFQDTLQDGSQGPDMVIIPAGSFLIGSPAGEGDDDERPQHEVPIARPFAVGKYPVTFEEYDRITKATRGNQRGDEGWGLRSAARGGGTPGLRIDNLGCCLAQDV